MTRSLAVQTSLLFTLLTGVVHSSYGQTNDATGTESNSPPNLPAAQSQLTGEEVALLAEVEQDYTRYQQAADGHHLRIRATLLREWTERNALLEKRYSERIARAEEEKKRRHLDTIALLRKFIKNYPDHEQFTPDAMFRLADLYLDQANVKQEEQEESGVYESDAIADYSESLLLWQEIVERFPNYRQLAGTLYLLAYYTEIQDERRSLALYRSLVCANKFKYIDPSPPLPNREQVNASTSSRILENPYADCIPLIGADDALIQHAWVRGIGDHHFNVPGELSEAIAAYVKVISDKKSSLYSEAIYKLAWSYYRRDFLLEAIQYFDESVRLYDATIARREQPKLELRDEALQYIAVAFTDPWNNEPETAPTLALQRAQDFYKGRESETHVRDVWLVLGRAFIDLQAYDQAIDSFYKAIGEPWHLHPDNPIVHQEIVNAHEAKGDKFAADQAAAELAMRYGPGTEWYLANEKDRSAMENQRRISERMLYAAARNMHTAATEARQEYEGSTNKNPQAKQSYIELYARAIELYISFLKQYPESEYVYDFTFSMAEAMYFSERYLDAIEHYRWVRDHRDLSSKYFNNAAYSIVQAYEAEAERKISAGELSPIRVPTTDELRALPQPIEPQVIPPIHRSLQDAYDEYQVLINDPKTAPQMALNAALVALAYFHLDDAIRRFEIVLERFCGAPEAVKAKDGLLSIYDARGNSEKFKEINEAFIKSKCGDQEAIALAKSQNRSIEFRRASQLFAEKQYAEAARQFYIYYKTAPDTDKDLPTALYNAAIAFREADKPKTAIHLLKEFTANKSPSFRSSPYYLEALRLTAVSYQSVFDYDTAISIYKDLYTQAKTAKQRGLTPPPPAPGEQPKTFDEIKLDAIYNAAVLAELRRDFKEAVNLYRQYEQEETDRRRQDRALWSIARIYRSSGDLRSLDSSYAAWRRKYGDDPGNEDDYIATYHDLAKAHARQRQNSAFEKDCREVIDAWERKGSQKRTRGAEFAGECALHLVEIDYAKTFIPYQIKRQARTEKQAKEQISELDRITKQMQDKYLALGRFGVGEYAMAAKVRYGDILALYTQKVFEMPTPKYVMDLNDKAPELELLAKYEEAMAQKLQSLMDDAKKEWVDVVESAKQKNIFNKWTKLALENLNREFPDEFPILHEELNEGTENP